MVNWPLVHRIAVSLGGLSATGVVVAMAVVALGIRGAWGRAAAFVAMMLALVCIDVAGKTLYSGWGADHGWTVYRAASGHVMRSMAAYPTFAWIVFAGSSRRRRAIGIAAGILMAAVVAIASLDPRNHTLAEVCVGVLLGLVVPFVVARMGALKPLSTSLQAFVVVYAIALYTFVPTTHYDFDDRVMTIGRHTRCHVDEGVRCVDRRPRMRGYGSSKNGN